VKLETANESALLAPDPIREVACFDCSVALPEPLAVGEAVIDRRTYAILRIRTESGLEGAAYAFARGLPVAAIIERSLSPTLMGADATASELLRARLAGA
jgi:L-alanine-DL-glutamate epimerase-like enolase superfamily enzyme